MEETDVMATLSASSALNNEHHQLEWLPPGLAVMTKREITMAWENPKSWSTITAQNPKKGMIRNFMVTPVKMANLLVS